MRRPCSSALTCTCLYAALKSRLAPTKAPGGSGKRIADLKPGGASTDCGIEHQAGVAPVRADKIELRDGDAAGPVGFGLFFGKGGLDDPACFNLFR